MSYVESQVAHLDEQFGYLMLYFHLPQNGRPIIRDGDISVRRDEDLVKTYALAQVRLLLGS